MTTRLQLQKQFKEALVELNHERLAILIKDDITIYEKWKITYKKVKKVLCQPFFCVFFRSTRSSQILYR